MAEHKKHNNSLNVLIKNILKVFYANNKKQFLILLLIIFFSGLADVISFTLIIPVMYIINDPLSIQDSKVLHLLYQQFQFNSVGHFTLFLLFGLVIIFLLKNLFLLACVFIQSRFVYKVAHDILKKKLSDFYMSDYLDIKKNNSIEYVRCFLEAPQGFADMLMMPLVLIMNESLVIIIVLIALLFYMPSVILLLFISIVPVGYLMVRLAKKKLQENSDTRSTIEKEAYVSTVEGVNAYRDIRLFNRENIFIHSILNIFKKYYDVLIMTNLYLVTPRRIIEVLLVTTICLLFIIVYFVLGATKNQMILVLLTFSTAAYRILPSLNEIVTNIVRIRTNSYLLELLEFIKEPKSVHKTFEEIKFHQKIELKNINFYYPESKTQVLSNFILSIKKGDFVLLSGESGTGKTTVGKILTGFVKPDSGTYLIDDIEVQDINQIRNFIGYVTQDFYLLDKSLLENITLGDAPENVNLEKVEQIIQATNLKNLVDSLPKGIHQPIGEMGSKLSGGQRQRIAIARALYKNVEFLILDEATSSLDKENEMDILDTIYAVSKQKNITVLIFTHRVSSVTKFDEMYVLENGRIKN